jgi:hypothetical protein
MVLDSKSSLSQFMDLGSLSLYSPGRESSWGKGIVKQILVLLACHGLVPDQLVTLGFQVLGLRHE